MTDTSQPINSLTAQEAVSRLIDEARKLGSASHRNGLELLLTAFFGFDGIGAAVDLLSAYLRVLTPGFWNDGRR